MTVTPKVTIECMTYNHAPYITDAMNGFCMQQTNFPFVAVIIDDASTDEEPKVIKSYLDEHFLMSEARQWETEDAIFIEAQHTENKKCWFAVVFLKYNFWQAKKDKAPLSADWYKDSKYIAWCEGDDYWIGPNKLQIQFDFLETHSDYSMCFHDVDIKAEKCRAWYDVFGKLEDRDYTGMENMITWSVPSCSMFLRKEVNDRIPKNDKFTMGDNVLILTCSRNGKIRCIPKKMGVYRLTPTSWIGGQSDKIQRYKYISHYKGLIEEFEECHCQEMYDILEGQYFQLLTILKRDGDSEEFEHVKQEYLAYPGTTHWNQFRPYYIKSRIRSAFKSFLGDTLVRIARKVKN